MLVLSRKIGEVITIGSSITVKILSFDRGVVRIGIEAPKTISVHRKEVYDKIVEMNIQATKTQLRALKEAISGSKIEFGDIEIEKLQPPTLVFSTKNVKKKE